MTTSTAQTRIWISFGQFSVKRRNRGAMSDSPLFHFSPPRFYSVLLANSTSALPSSIPTSIPTSTPTSTDATTPESKSNVMPLAVGLTFGLLTLAIAALGAFYFVRRRRRNSALLDARARAQSDQLSVSSQDIKRLSQPPTNGSTPSSGALAATVVPTMSIGIPESGMATSHETCEVRESGPA